jgi:GT2 family glycosyltransferase
VIPTKDRPDELRTMMASLAAQDARPAQVVVVDASAVPQPELPSSFPDLPIEYVRYAGTPSAAAQRNTGAQRVAASADLICFFDDDQTLLPGALAAMLRFWEDADSTVAGAGFNLRNEIDRRPSAFKRSRLAEWLGLYARRRGAVAPSGWQTLPGVVRRDLDVEWLTTGAAVWRRALFDAHGFDEFYGSYSYLEDLDFSYGLSRTRRLVIVADAGVHHYPSKRGRVSHYRFGLMEVRNRLHFVRKHGLSAMRCRVALTIRMGMSLGVGLVLPWRGGLKRAWGNLVGLLGGEGATP